MYDVGVPVHVIKLVMNWYGKTVSVVQCAVGKLLLLVNRHMGVHYAESCNMPKIQK